ncbi:MAG TPA: crosslink repair DNA glycosylase YcaQ family protein [Dehalococcoidia bacterium]|nr:crosslink repair DNA glycosylase YcaQ family protein [Dehalococcoidia bacterium]
MAKRRTDGVAATSLTLSASAARALMLAAQGLLREPERQATKDDLLTCIRQMGALQIDTIHVVARSPYFVLWSRLGAYAPGWLDELLAEGALFEYWAHAACMLPIEDFPLFRRLRLAGLRDVHGSDGWLRQYGEVSERVLAHVRERGPTRALDFEGDGAARGGWWDWKPETRALDYLHTTMALMIVRRERFQRLYDLRERILPAWDDASTPPLPEVYRALTLKALRALGVAKASWLPDYFRLPKAGVAAALRELVEAGEALPASVDGWSEPVYIAREELPLVDQAAAGALRPERTTLLTPFDPLIWHRARLREAFAFDYLLECYVPAAKRRYGYFTLAILHGDAVVGRLDAKAQRKAGQFEVFNLYLEPEIAPDGELAAAIASALRDCAAWHATPEVVVRRSEPAGFAAQLQRNL